MGCISSKAPILEFKSPTKNQLTQPEIPHQQPLCLFLSNLETTQRACGYNFNTSSHPYNLHNQSATNSYKSYSTLETNAPQPMDQFNILLQKCIYYYKQHDIDTSFQYLTFLQKLKDKYYNQQQFIKEYNSSMSTNLKLFNQIKQEYHDVINYEKDINRDGWIEKSHKNGIKISTRREDSTVSVLVQAIIDQPFQILITALIEMDLYKQFMPFMAVSRQEKIVARNCRIGYTQNSFPIFSIREAFFQGVGYTRLHKTNRLFLFTRSIHNRPDLQQKLGYKCNIHPEYVQLEYKFFVLQYEPICKGKGKIIIAMNVDTKMDFIPMWIQDKISQDFGQEFFANIMRISKKFKNSQWEKNTQANPHLFLFFKNEIDKYLAENQHMKQELSLRQRNNSNIL